MDVVLEACDTYIFDRAYAALLPIGQAYSVLEPISTLAAGIKEYALENESWARNEPVIVGSQATNGWQWKPASSLLSFPPSQYAYQSQLDRDNVWRQTISLFIITW